MFNFENLEVYQASIDYAEEIYRVTKKFPKYELYGVTSQFRCASLSISQNIAEGSSRSKKQFCYFLDIARGSVLECIPLLRISLSENYIKKQICDQLYRRCESLSMMICKLKASLSTNDER